MTYLYATDLALAAKRAIAAMRDIEQLLNAADAQLGDGDTGGMLARVLDQFSSVAVTEADIGKSFVDYASAAAGVTGSSLGTLLATALLAMARDTRGRSAVPLHELGSMLGRARDAMLERGKTALGDKTVIDALDAVSGAIEAKGNWDLIAPAAVEAAEDVLARFRDLPCKIGRARMWGDKSRGLDDPGMLAFVKLTIAVSGRN